MLFITVLLSLGALIAAANMQGSGFSVLAYLLYGLFIFALPGIAKKVVKNTKPTQPEPLQQELAPQPVQNVISVLEPVLQQEPISESVAHRELRKQFEEKSEVLHQARKELFLLQGAHFTLQRELEEQAFEAVSFAIWQKELEDLQQENEILQKENQILQEMIAATLEKTPPTRKFFLPDDAELYDLSFL